MKKVALKTLCIILVVVITLNFSCSTSYADRWRGALDDTNTTNTTTTDTTTSDVDNYDDPTANIAGADAAAIKEENAAMQGVTGVLGTLLDGLVGILLYLPKLLALGIGAAIQVITGGMVVSSGVQIENLEQGLDAVFITPETILFNRAAIVDINFFTDTYADGESLPSNSPIRIIRDNIAGWYYGLRNLAIIILLCILIYVGIKMAMSTLAEEQAKYKRMLVDWVVSFVLIFVLQYIILITINANNALVRILYNSIDTVEGSLLFQDVTAALVTKALSPLATVGIGATLVYIGVIAMTLAFLIMYIKRMITIAFLILIAPIITITYSLDKMKDKTAQALNTWLQEFIYNILVQPFHCILYLVFVVTAIKLLNGTLAGMIFALLMMFFIFQAEDIIRKIFNLGAASSLGKMAGSMATVYAGYKLLENGAKKTTGAATKAGGGAAKLPGGGPKTTSSAGKGGSSGGSGSSRGSGSSGGGNSLGGSGSSGGNGSSGRGSSSSRSGSSGRRTSSSGSGSSFGKKVITGVKKGVVNAGKWVGKTNMNMLKSGVTGMLIGSMIGGMAKGDAVGMIAGGVAGKSVDKAIGNKIQGIAMSNKVQSQERIMASMYDKYKNDNGYDNKTMDGITDAMIAMDPSKVNRISDADEKALASGLHNMMNMYGKVGYDDPEKAMKDTIKAIQAGKIKPKFKK